MVTIIDDPYSGNVFGRLGKGIGKGLSEQLPKEIERSRLSSGLKKFEQESQGKTPLQQYLQLSSIPGMTPEHLYNIRPLLERQQRVDAFGRKVGTPLTGAESGKTEPKTSLTEGKGEISADEAKESSGFATSGEIERYKRDIEQPPSQKDIDNLASQYIASGMALDPEEARNIAAKEIQQNILARKHRTSTFLQDAKSRIQRELQSAAGGTITQDGQLMGGLADYPQVAGEIQQALLDQGEYLVNQQGMTPEQASLKMSNLAKELGKTANKVKELGTYRKMFRSSTAKTNDLKAQKAEFEKHGFGEIFDDLAASAMGITPLQAAHILSPIKNKELQGSLNSLKRIAPRGEIVPMPIKQMDNIISRITPKDNLLDIAYNLRDKGYDYDQFKGRLLEMIDEGEVALSPRQRRQLEKSVDQSYYGDLLYQMF